MPSRPINLVCLAITFVCLAAESAPDPANLCDDAALGAANHSNVPLNVLLAITRVETGRGSGHALRPWPWTINQAGLGRWFDTEVEATEAAQAAVIGGNGNLDIGCFQLNHRWHGENFASLEAMFDPDLNAGYAAAFLSDLYREKGDWPAAVSAYHSRNAGPASAYLARIKAVLASQGEVPVSPAARENSYPLLQAGGQGSGGSLVPRQTANRPLIGRTP